MPCDSTPPDGLEEWEINALHTVVNAFAADRELPPELNVDDLFQEAAMHWLKQRSRYSEQYDTKVRTYLSRVVESRLKDVLRDLRAQKRGQGRLPLSIDQEQEALGGARLSDFLPAPDEGMNEYLLDAGAVVGRLTPRQRRVIKESLDGYTVLEVASRLSIHRDTVYEELKRIRSAFRDEGLEPPHRSDR